MTNEAGEIVLPGGIKFKGAAIKGFWQNLGWILCICSLAFSLYGPPQKIAVWMGTVDARLAAIEKKLDGPKHFHRQEAGIPEKEPKS